MNREIQRVVESILRMDEGVQEQLWDQLVRRGVGVAKVTPQIALYIAQDNGGTDALRVISSRDAWCAFMYADKVDRKPHELTRKGVLVDPKWAYEYASRVDKEPREDTREASSKGPWEAVNYARYVDRGPHPVTLKGACQSSWEAYLYASQVFRNSDSEEIAEAVRGTEHELLFRSI